MKRSLWRRFWISLKLVPRKECPWIGVIVKAVQFYLHSKSFIIYPYELEHFVLDYINKHTMCIAQLPDFDTVSSVIRLLAFTEHTYYLDLIYYNKIKTYQRKKVSRTIK